LLVKEEGEEVDELDGPSAGMHVSRTYSKMDPNGLEDREV
jgi:hypothetical protein